MPIEFPLLDPQSLPTKFYSFLSFISYSTTLSQHYSAKLRTTTTFIYPIHIFLGLAAVVSSLSYFFSPTFPAPSLLPTYNIPKAHFKHSHYFHHTHSSMQLFVRHNAPSLLFFFSPPSLCSYFLHIIHVDLYFIFCPCFFVLYVFFCMAGVNRNVILTVHSLTNKALTSFVLNSFSIVLSQLYCSGCVFVCIFCLVYTYTPKAVLAETSFTWVFMSSRTSTFQTSFRMRALFTHQR